MRPEEDNNSPLDLNNFPDDQFSRDGRQILFDHDSSSGGYRRKKNGGNGKADGKDEREKVYECRFCSLKFCKSQALGGHMNRHRQERETETLNRARQLVFNSDNLVAAQGHLGCHIPSYPTNNMGDPTLQFRPAVYPPRMLASAGASPTLIPTPTPTQPPLYPSPSSLYPINDYYVGHVLRGATTAPNLSYMGAANAEPSSYTCIGAPVGHGFPTGPSQIGTRFGQ